MKPGPAGAALAVFVSLAFGSPAGAVTATVPCEKCHEQVATWRGRQNVHAPVDGGDCTACHNPHASKHGFLLGQEVKEVCLNCHEDILAGMSPAQAHRALSLERACVACHDPHASERPKLLAGENTVELCAGCHEEIVRQSRLSVQHAPVAAGGCRSCHSPHASPNPALGRKAQPDLCLTCHPAGKESMAAAHRKIPLAGARCTGCHAPHGSDAGGLMHAVLHPPFAEGGCDTCHEGEGAQAIPRSGINDLCLVCHEPRSTGHPIPEEATCVNCHTPHSSEMPALIRAPEREVCLSCHQEKAAVRAIAAAVHPAFGGRQDCTVCHELHTGKTSALLKKPSAQETCKTCHASHARFSHPMGEGVPDPSHPGHFVGCLSCHDPHGTPHERFLIADPAQALCLRCHETGQ